MYNTGEIMKKVAKYIPIIYLTLTTLWLRLFNLGYSDFQGDEIKALFLPASGQSFVDFLLAQRKGPTQFIITYILKLFDPQYSSTLLMRLPFAIAGILAVFFFYHTVKMHYGKKIAMYSSIFFSANGIFIAFARIVQYQSFVILFSMLALYFFTLALKNVRWRIAGLYYGMTFWGLAILSHYDGIFIAPFAFYIFWEWFKMFPSKKISVKLMHIFLSGSIAAALLAVFYIPFILSVSDSTTAYWLDRLSGGEGKLSSSIVTFKVYNPKLVVHAYRALGLIYLIRLIWIGLATKFKKLSGNFEVTEVYKSSIWVLLWFLFPWIFMEVITSVPGTHIYTYLLPAMILISFGIIEVETLLRKVFSKNVGLAMSYFGLSIAFLFTFYLSHTVFVDHSREYPWETEKFLVWELQKPNVIFHLSLFGFPYYRHWAEIGTYVNSNDVNKTGYYSTNERQSMSRYHINLNKDTDSAGFFVYIVNPQSFAEKIVMEKAAYWASRYEPAKVFYNGDREVAKIYYMPVGSKDEIKLLGY